MQKLLKVLGLTLLLLSFAVAAFGQTETGQITGTVKDKSGAVVPNAKVTLVAVETNTTRTAITSAAGLYNFPSLKPAVYKVTVEAAGFEKFERQVTVNVSSNVDVSAQLLVGSSTTVVEVSATSADVAVNTENQTISTVINTSDLENLPTDANRNPYALVQLSSNATPDSNSNRGAGYALNGERSASTSILLDGAENVDTFTAGVGQQVPLDSVQEFSVLTSNFGAEFGRASGGVINLVTKSGTNHLHGSVYEFNRISKLSSNTYYNNANDVPKSIYTRNNFGFSVGGPVIKNKLFFFENLEWLRVRSAGQNEADIIDPASYSSLQGGSNAFLTQYGKLGATTKVKATGPCNTGAQAGSTITCDLVNYTAPTDAGGGLPENTWDQVGKVDWNISSKTTLTGRYAAYHEVDQAGTINNSPYAGYNTGQTLHDQNLTISLTHIFSPSIVSTSKVVYNRIYQLQPLGTNPVGPTLYTTNVGIPSVPTPGIQQPLIFPGYSAFTPGNAIPFGGPQNLYQLYQDFSITKGKHQIKFGGQFIQLRDNRTFGAYEEGVEALGTDYNSALANLIAGQQYEFQAAIDPQGEYPCVKDLSGHYQVTPACTLNLPMAQPKFNRNYRYNDGAVYGQDSWKISSRLTVNAGLRWEYYGVQHNADQNLDSNFVMGPGATVFDRIRNGAVELSKNGGVFWKPQYGNFGPHIGFAFDPFGKGKTSIRGGYSIGYERNFGNVTFNAIQNPPHYATLAEFASDTESGVLPVYTENLGPVGPSAGGGTIPFHFGVSQRAINQNMKTAYAETFNLGIEQTVFNNAIFTLGYAGSHGVHEYDIANINLSKSGSNYLGDARAANRLNLQYSSMNYRSDNGYNHYNALLTGFKANNIAKTGVNVYANYQWSHALDNLSSTFTDGIPANYGTGYIDAFNPKIGYGNADYDVRHRLVVSSSWEVPWMKNATNKAERYALGGWVVSGTFNARSGMPFSIYDGDNFNGSVYPLYAPGTGHKLASSGSAKNAGGGYFNYINVPIDPSTGSVYNAGNSLGLPSCTGLYHVGCTYTSDGSAYPDRNQFKGPNFWNADMQFLKNFKFSEKFGMQFRAEFYNIFNHHNQYTYAYGLDVSGMAVGSNSIQTAKGASSGVPGSPNDEHRNVDLGLKITF